MSSFSRKEREDEATRRKAADLDHDARRGAHEAPGPKATCIHCQRAFPISEGHVGEVSLCDHCLHRD